MNDESSEPAPQDDAESVRLAMIRRLLVRSIRHYWDTLGFVREVDEALPVPYHAFPRTEVLSEEERAGWTFLLGEAEDEFYSAELGLASRICNLYDQVAPEDRRIDLAPPGDSFVERGVSLDGMLYILTNSPANFEAGRDIIAVVRADRLVGLD